MDLTRILASVLETPKPTPTPQLSISNPASPILPSQDHTPAPNPSPSLLREIRLLYAQNRADLENLRMKKIQTFAQQLESLAQQHQDKAWECQARTLHEDARSFDVERCRSFLQKIKSLLEAEPT
ncbi:MAG: hypothetical protein HC904_01940 [Blastochloris sp.]|nr:hypothetical protein [Blastochloris sp.]